MKKPATKTPTAKKPATKKPATKTPTAKKPATKKPVAKKPVAKKPVAKKPAANKPATKKPAATPSPAAVSPTLSGRIQALWARLEALAKKAGRSLTLNPGATEATIAAAESTMGLAFPQGFRASLALHDGMAAFSAGSEDAMPWMPGCCPLAPIAELLPQWTELQGLADEYPAPDVLEEDGHVKAGPYRRKLIPIAGTQWWDGDNTYLDLDPGPKGTVGQLITMTTESDFGFMGHSFEEALERWIGLLESGAWIYDTKRKAVYPKGEKPYDGNAAARFTPL